MNPTIVDRNEFAVIGLRAVVHADTGETAELWRSFLPRFHEVRGGCRTYYSVFNPHPNDDDGYDYVAGVRGTLEDIPVAMAGWVVPAGSYAEVAAQGLEGMGTVCRHLITDWMPDSEYILPAGPVFSFTDHSEPHSGEAVWKVNIPLALAEQLEQLKRLRS